MFEPEAVSVLLRDKFFGHLRRTSGPSNSSPNGAILDPMQSMIVFFQGHVGRIRIITKQNCPANI